MHPNALFSLIRCACLRLLPKFNGQSNSDSFVPETFIQWNPKAALLIFGAVGLTKWSPINVAWFGAACKSFRSCKDKLQKYRAVKHKSKSNLQYLSDLRMLGLWSDIIWEYMSPQSLGPGNYRQFAI